VVRKRRKSISRKSEAKRLKRLFVLRIMQRNINLVNGKQGFG